jgi:hypothetical protein
MAKYYCNSCTNFTETPIKKGNGIIEIVLWLCYLLPGLIYSIWRRSGVANVCPTCKVAGLVLAAMSPKTAIADARDEVDCPFCAERILAKAQICKHCNKQVRVA